MDNYIAEKLSELHNEFSLFTTSNFRIEAKKNIIAKLDSYKAVDNLGYLSDFYSYYQKGFSKKTKTKLQSPVARSIDLPFIGETVINSKKAEFIFYFEGSLSKVERLSITVLAHLWQIDDDKIIEDFCNNADGWWTKHNYNSLKRKLDIPVEVIKRSYIADSVRFSDKNENKDLIYKEINLLKPELVICVGNEARDIVGMKYLDLPTKFHHVKFPKYHNDVEIYSELKEILHKVLKK